MCHGLANVHEMGGEDPHLVAVLLRCDSHIYIYKLHMHWIWFILKDIINMWSNNNNIKLTSLTRMYANDPFIQCSPARSARQKQQQWPASRHSWPWVTRGWGPAQRTMTGPRSAWARSSVEAQCGHAWRHRRLQWPPPDTRYIIWTYKLLIREILTMANVSTIHWRHDCSLCRWTTVYV